MAADLDPGRWPDTPEEARDRELSLRDRADDYAPAVVPAERGRRPRREGELLRATYRRPIDRERDTRLAVVVEVSPTTGDDRDGLVIEAWLDWQRADRDDGNSSYRSHDIVALTDDQALFALRSGALVLQRGAARESCMCLGGSTTPHVGDRTDTCGLCGLRRQL